MAVWFHLSWARACVVVAIYVAVLGGDSRFRGQSVLRDASFHICVLVCWTRVAGLADAHSMKWLRASSGGFILVWRV